jgi:hypothetical protein
MGKLNSAYFKFREYSLKFSFSPCKKLFFIFKFGFFEKKTKISIYGGISKFLKLIVFGQILLHWQWLRACPNFG